MAHGAVKVVVAYHSGYGHTGKLAEQVVEGAGSVAGTDATAIDVSAIDDAGWRALEAADAIVFGSPTYMGGVSAPFKAFADASSKVWMTRSWQDKFAAGFTCSLQMEGDKHGTLVYLATLAMQHGMIWVGLGLPGPSVPGDPDERNRIGASFGAMAQADNLPADETPPQGDLDTAFALGVRVASIAALDPEARRAIRPA